MRAKQQNNQWVGTYTAQEKQDDFGAMHGCSVANWLKYSVSLPDSLSVSALHQVRCTNLVLNQCGPWRTASAGQSLVLRAHGSAVQTRTVSTKKQVTTNTKKSSSENDVFPVSFQRVDWHPVKIFVRFHVIYVTRDRDILFVVITKY